MSSFGVGEGRGVAAGATVGDGKGVAARTTSGVGKAADGRSAKRPPASMISTIVTASAIPGQ